MLFFFFNSILSIYVFNNIIYINLFMIYLTSIISIIETLLVVLPALLTVAFVTISERKTMASMQRRLGPNIVGYYGLLQAFADALKLLLKEYIAPTQANIILFFLGPIITLIFSLLGYAMIPYGSGLYISDFSLGILYVLAVSSLATYGILLAGWSANSKYAFLGSLRSTAQLISYELILSSVILLVILLTGSLNLTSIIEAQNAVYFFFPLFPLFIVFFIGCIAETNRAPFDLAEAESELVSGFMTEHSAVIFVFFFLAEYASIVLICILTSVLFLGGYLNFLPFDIVLYLFNFILYLFNFIYKILYFFFDLYFAVLEFLPKIIRSILCYTYLPDSFIAVLSLNSTSLYELTLKFNELSTNLFNLNLEFDFKDKNYLNSLFNSFLLSPTWSSLSLAFKTSALIFIFIWIRASFPRIRFDQLMSVCWTVLLPIVIAYIILIPCIVCGLGIIPTNLSLL